MTFYELLGVSPNASGEEIAKAYRSKAMEAHPDRGGTADAFRALKEAFDVLSDPVSRKQYDESGCDSSAMSKRAHLQETARELFRTFVDSGRIKPAWILRKMRDHIAEIIRRSVDSLPDKRKKAERLTTYRKAATPKAEGVPDIFSEEVESLISIVVRDIEATEAQIQEGRDLLEFLNGYKFTGPPALGFSSASSTAGGEFSSFLSAVTAEAWKGVGGVGEPPESPRTRFYRDRAERDQSEMGEA